MPELPEVETIRRRLEPVLVDRVFRRVAIADPRLTRPLAPRSVARALEGEQVARVRRRGKYLIFGFSSGRSLLVHLRMTGTFRTAAADDKHQRAVITLDNDEDVIYRDVRRFGTWRLLEADELEPYLRERLGPDPLERAFTSAVLGRALEGRRAPVKAVLLDQRAAAGVGNIYADEALWRARLHPLRPARSLAPGEVRALHRAVRRALELGIACQGASLRDYSTPDGSRGAMQLEFAVYGRAGLSCPRCRTPVTRIRAAGRGSWLCPRCQPPP